MSNATVRRDPSCADDSDPASLSVDAALQRILSAITPLQGVERVAIRDALDRVLAADVQSRIDVPSGTNSAMDGYAVIGTDIPGSGIRELKLIGTAWAGRPLAAAVTPGTTARIMTGALLPDGADTVVIQEQVECSGELVRIGPGTRPGDNVRMAGEDIAAGTTVLARGCRLTPADIGLLASLGIGEVDVTRRPRVAFFSTGDELRAIGEPLGDGEIYDSNRYTLFGMLARIGADIIDMGVVRDVPDELEVAFRQGAANADVLITSGGVSVGEADFVKDVLQRTGSVDFWKVAMKPGRPLSFGRVGNAWFFGLPGNPVSVMVTFYQFVQPALVRMMGQTGPRSLTIRIPCVSKLKKRPGRVEYQRGLLERDESGQLVVRKTGAQGSGILTSMSRADCFIILPMDNSGVEPGEMVEVQPFFGLI
jgi:molybdopterin molybdotransferase